MLFLIKAAVRTQALGAISGLLVPARDVDRIHAAYRLITGLLTTDPKHKRDFLWREDEPGNLTILAPKEPTGFAAIFELSVAPFMPKLNNGDQVLLHMRVSPTVHKAVEGARRPKRYDLIMDALHNTPSDILPQVRQEVVQRTAAEWLAKQGELHGFQPDCNRVHISRNRRLSIAEPDGGKMSFSMLDIGCPVKVVEAQKLEACIQSGLGGARAFGCGLILIVNRPDEVASAGLVSGYPASNFGN